MTKRLWVILGATSAIAEQFAHLIAAQGISLLLIARDEEQLKLIAQDIHLRFKVPCTIRVINLKHPIDELLYELSSMHDIELDLFIAHSVFTDNDGLNTATINELITVNVLATTQLIHTYLNLKQKTHHIIYLSSVAAARGRAKNSLYGATKACIELYLEGLQQAAPPTKKITIARLGYIDTKQTYGMPGIFYAASPQSCAKACLKALEQNKSRIYYPFFWRGIMGIIQCIPLFMYKKMSI